MADSDLSAALSQHLQASMANLSLNPQNPSVPNFSHLNTIKLSPSNFPLWSQQIAPYLRSQRLMAYADGSLPCPIVEPDGSNAKAIDDWNAKDQLVVAILSASLTESILTQILTCQTSHQIWSRLHQLYSARSNAQIVQSRLQLASLKKGDESVTDYFNRAQTLVQQIQAAGQIISDDEFVVYLLAGLGSDYDAMVTTLSTQPILPTPTLTLSYLLMQESRLTRNNGTTVPSSQSILGPPPTQSQTPELNFTASRGRGRGRGEQGRGRGRDDRGGRSGRGRGSYNFNGGPDTRPICQICEKRGHIATRCWSRFDHSFQTPPPSSLQANFTTSNWFPDTAANHHYTPDVSNLRFDRLPYEGTDSISLGDGSTIPIQSHGFRDANTTSQGPR